MKSYVLKITIVLFLAVIVNSVSAQRDPFRYNKIDDEYIEMTQYENDTTAKAVILGNYGVIEIRYGRNGFESHYMRRIRVKVLDQDAADIANYSLPLYSSGTSRERLANLKAAIYTPENGKVIRTKFKRRDTYEEEISDNLKYVNFTLPNVKEGTVYDLEYTIVSPFLGSLPIWYFQDVYPTVLSELRLYIPEYFYYKPMMGGYLALDERSNDSRQQKFRVEWEEVGFMNKRTKHSANIDYIENITILRVNNAPAFKTEPFMNSRVNYLSKIEHEIVNFRMPYGPSTDYSSTWTKLSKQLLESNSFGKALNRSNFLRDEVSKIMETYSDPAERMVAAFSLIQQEMTWNNRNGIYATQSLRKVWDDKQGNAADINLLLVVLLRDLEIDAEPVILSTRSHGMVNPTQIMLSSFNYVVAWAKVGDDEFVMDATEKYTPFYLLPPRCINGEGRLISETHGRWVSLEAYADNTIHTISNITVKPSGSIHVDMSRHKVNYMRLAMDQDYRSFDREEDFLDDFESDHPGMELIEFEMQNRYDWSEPLITHYEYEIPEIDTSPKEVLYVNAMGIDQMDVNPFLSDERLFPVDFTYPTKRTYEINIDIPEGYTVEELPRNVRFNMPGRGGRFVCNYSVNDDNTIQVNVEYELSKALYTGDEYHRVKNFFSRMVEEQARLIVLKKIS
ncbi:MAG: hypothetical protein ABR597_01335 [Bacteroidales bacterium]